MRLWLGTFVLLLGVVRSSYGQVSVPDGAPASFETPSPSIPDPSVIFEHARARIRFGVSQHSGSLQDLGPGLTFSGLTPNDTSLFLAGYAGRHFGGWLSLNREGLSLYQADQRVAQRSLLRASVGPAARFSLRQLRLEIGAGYHFAHLPNFTNSQNGTLQVAQRHAVFAGLRGRVPLSRTMSVEVTGELPISLSAKDVSGAKASASGAAVGLGVHYALARTNRLGWGLAADYQWVNDAVTAANGSRGTQTIHRVGLSLDVTLLDPLPVIARIEPPPPPPAPPKPGALRIVVKHALKNTPIVDAAVTVGETEVKTNAEGFAQIDDLTSGPTEINVVARGFKPSKEVAAMTDDLDTDLTVLLQPSNMKAPATLSGLVRSRPEGAPIAATLRILNTDRRTESDANGAFRLQVAPGTYRVIISAPGYRSQRKTVRLREGEQTIFNVDLHPENP